MSAVLNPSPALAESLAAAACAVGGVLSGASLNAGLEAIRPRTLRAAAQDLSFNALRGYGLIDAALDRLLARPQPAIRLRRVTNSTLRTCKKSITKGRDTSPHLTRSLRLFRSF